MIENLLGAAVACAESFGDRRDAVLFPAEEARATAAVEGRRREFATGRACARTALAALGVGPAAIGTGEGGAPQWPPGVVGSITHCAGYRAAAVARAADVLTVGLDAEPEQALPGGVLDLISLPGERGRLRDLAAAAPGRHWDRLLFSAKETVYKAWFPMTGRWLDFDEADIAFDASVAPGGRTPPCPPERTPSDGAFYARLLAVGSPLAGFRGRWRAADGLVLTAIAVPAAQIPADRCRHPGMNRAPDRL